MGPQMTSTMLVALSLALAYSVWFRSHRGALGFAWLIWLVLGLGVNRLPGPQSGIDLDAVVRSLAPWNLLLLAILPTTSLRRPGGLAIVCLWALQLLLAMLVSVEAREQLAAVNQLLVASLPGSIAPTPRDFESLLTVMAALTFFVRWQVTNQPNELALSLASCCLIFGIYYPQNLFIPLMLAGVTLFLSVLYSTHRLAFVDALTGLHNRRSLDAAMGHLGRRYAIAMLDIDHFKRVNDRFGHDFGDQVLRMVATRVREIRGFQVYRYGGEEFCLIFKGRVITRAREICEAVREVVNARPIVMRSIQRPPRKPPRKQQSTDKAPAVKVSVSIGLAWPSEKLASPEAVREAADKALYRAKKKGRNRVEQGR